MGAPPSITDQLRADQLGPLADANQFHGPLVLPAANRGWLADALRGMLQIRAVEERIGEMVSTGAVRCPCHLAIGQEAVAVGVALQIRKGDRIFGAHRSHSHYLALGGDMHRLFAEVLGRRTGASRGMGGSMHLLDLEHGLLGTVPIVGATIPVAVGAGLAARFDGAGGVAVSFFGDGATEEGSFHEAMNLAAVLKAPVLFVCENNLFSSHLHIALRQPADSISRYAEAHRIPWLRVDGNDIVAIVEAARSLVEPMRDGGGPGFLEAVTYRWRGHVGPREDEDVGVQRKEDLASWKRRDPIGRLADALVAAGDLVSADVTRIRHEVRAEVAAASARAERDPYPAAESLLATVYGRPGRSHS
ncbi:MAG TPA: thiamine pyrophosphate-dependent dehydrogenase E1 component subunit alpha [Gemmatimonadales bacterium]|nr:thiamine pyrophosphate-dependent dehydrogenase E1 component subunit alpha [Gemmatimonadales bacterium]